MPNVALDFFKKNKRHIDNVSRRILQQKELFYHGGHGAIFYLYEHAHIVMALASCSVLSMECKDCINTDCVSEIEKQLAIIVTAFARVHNLSMAHDAQEEVFTSAVCSIEREVSDSGKTIKRLCTNLVRTANVVRPEFVKMCVCSRVIDYCATNLIYRFSRYKDCKLKAPDIIRGNFGIKSYFMYNVECSNQMIPMDEVLARNFEIFRKKLEESCGILIEKQNSFLLVEMEATYGSQCSFERMLCCMADAALGNTENRPLAAGAELLVSRDEGFIIKTTSEENVIDNPVVPSSNVCIAENNVGITGR